MKLGKPNWLSVGVQARINPPPIPLKRAAPETVKECDIINIKMQWYPARATSDTNDLEINMFENGKPEYFLKIMKNFKTAIDATGATSAAGKINYLRTILCVESQREFDNLENPSHRHNKRSYNAHQVRVASVSFLINALTKQKRAMRCACHA